MMINIKFLNFEWLFVNGRESTRAFGVFNPTAIRWAVVIESYEGVEGRDAMRSTDYMVDKVQWNSCDAHV